MILIAEQVVKNRLLDDSPSESRIKPAVLEITKRMYYHPEEPIFTKDIRELIDDIKEDTDETGISSPDYVYSHHTSS